MSGCSDDSRSLGASAVTRVDQAMFVLEGVATPHNGISSCPASLARRTATRTPRPFRSMTIRERGRVPPLDRNIPFAETGSDASSCATPDVGTVTPENTVSARSRADKDRGGAGRVGLGEDGRARPWGAGIGVSRARSSAFAWRFNQTNSSGGSWIASRGTFRNVFAIVDKVARRSAGSGTVGTVGVRRGDGAPTDATWREVVTTTAAG